MPNMFSNDKNVTTGGLYRPFRVAVVTTLATGARRVVAGQDMRTFPTLAAADDTFFAELEPLEASLDPMQRSLDILYARTVSDLQVQGVDREQAAKWAAKLGMGGEYGGK